jgi:Lon protease-like protein
MPSPAFHPGPQGLPATFSIFPLEGALLLPGGHLPLNIFEPRYLAMVQDALGEGRMFGMIQPDPAAPERAGGPGLYRIGCLGRVSAFSETEDGRLLITLAGLTRFAVAEELPMRNGYRRICGDTASFRADLAEPDAAIDRARLTGAMRAFFRARRIEANWDAVTTTADPQLVTTLAMICPFPPAEKQALLEAPDTASRAEMLVALMEMGAHGDPAGPHTPS